MKLSAVLFYLASNSDMLIAAKSKNFAPNIKSDALGIFKG